MRFFFLFSLLTACGCGAHVLEVRETDGTLIRRTSGGLVYDQRDQLAYDGLAGPRIDTWAEGKVNEPTAKRIVDWVGVNSLAYQIGRALREIVRAFLGPRGLESVLPVEPE